MIYLTPYVRLERLPQPMGMSCVDSPCCRSREAPAAYDAVIRRSELMSIGLVWQVTPLAQAAAKDSCYGQGGWLFAPNNAAETEVMEKLSCPRETG